MNSRQDKTFLLISKKAAEEHIGTALASGEEIKSMNILGEEDLENAWRRLEKWKKITRDMLDNIFSDSSISEEFYAWTGAIYGKPAPWEKRVANFESILQDHIDILDSLISRLSFITEVVDSEEDIENRLITNPDEIFIIHGRDEAMLQIAKSFIMKLGLKPIVLKEQPGGSVSTAEKLDEYSMQAKFAVVLLTPDDLGGIKGAEILNDRARQNVILEIGKFQEKLGRRNVAIILKGEIEVPSDILGMNYISWYNVIDSWQILLAREFRSAGIKFDFNNAL